MTVRTKKKLPRWGRLTVQLLATLSVLLMLGAYGGHLLLQASLPQLDGELAVEGLGAPVTIERDALGVPTLRAATRRDLALATGFVHAQDRFFQMDLLRRYASGRLAELLGSGLVDADRRLRAHDFERVAAEALENAPGEQRELLMAYTEGVNSALAMTRSRPWEYWLLQSEPRPWQPVDSVLSAFSLYLDLNDSTGEAELARAALRASLPPDLVAFLFPVGTQWDAPFDGGTWQAPPIPGPDTIDLRARRSAQSSSMPPLLDEPDLLGSNSWAVAGSHTASGNALLANDMHLSLRLPNVWYRARLVVTAPATARDLIGVTLPGLPLLFAGSNGQVAWGFTNSYGDWSDLVVVEVDPARADHYLSAAGSEPFSLRREVIAVRGEEPITVDIQSTRFGPIVAQDAKGRPLALAWTAQRPEATNLGVLELETVSTVEQALDAANRAGGPVQNFVAADARGRIGWTLLGQVPLRAGYDALVPSSWRAPGTGWIGWQSPAAYPRVIDPPTGRIWTANARPIEAERWLAFAGEGAYDLGARAGQIKEGLLALPAASAADMARIQLDDRALFLTRWRDLLLELLPPASLPNHPERQVARGLVERWSGRADPEDAGYRIVREFRARVRTNVFESLIAPVRARYPERKFLPSHQFEGPLWQLIQQRPLHLLDPRFASWEQALGSALDTALASLTAECGTLERCSWGERNRLQLRHPLSAALPFGQKWLDMPAEPLPGDSNMPRVQGPSFGASERLVVSPGREAEGLFHMPGGQSGHPLSPYYRAGHDAWVQGKPLPLLPGVAQHRLTLKSIHKTGVVPAPP